MTTTAAEDAAPQDATPDRAAKRAARRSARLARQIGRFAGEHGGSAEGALEYLGRRGTRIVLVGADGAWGDLVAPDHATALAAAEQAGLTVHDTLDGETAARLRTGPYEWKRMAGIQAPQHRPAAG